MQCRGGYSHCVCARVARITRVHAMGAAARYTNSKSIQVTSLCNCGGFVVHTACAMSVASPVLRPLLVRNCNTV